MAPDYYKKASVCRIVDANFEEAPFRALGRIRARRGGASVPRLSGYLPPLSKEAENGGATQACAASGSYAQGEEGTSPKSVISEGRPNCVLGRSVRAVGDGSSAACILRAILRLHVSPKASPAGRVGKKTRGGRSGTFASPSRLSGGDRDGS